MKEIWNQFAQMHKLIEDNHTIQELQEIRELAWQLHHRAETLLAQELKEFAFNDAFLGDMYQVSDQHLFGQCGDRIYWKIRDRNLYISGSGPMWDFDSASSGLSFKKGVSPLWRGKDFDNIIICNGVTSIGVSAFESVHALNVIIPSTVRLLSAMAFFDARIERLMVPETIDTIDEYVATGFSRVVDTLIISVNIPTIKPYAFFNRDDIIANTIVLTGELPEDLTQLVESCLFDRVDCCKIYYPQDWDSAESSFCEGLIKKFPDASDSFLLEIKKALIPHSPSNQ